MLETISLLSLVLLATVNVFFASLLSLAVPLNEHFNTWWDFCEVVEVVILGAVPVVSCLLVFAAIVSQLCRIIFVVSPSVICSQYVSVLATGNKLTRRGQ